jgi:membrane fusion protein (multidrug efflux system)
MTGRNMTARKLLLPLAFSVALAACSDSGTKSAGNAAQGAQRPPQPVSVVSMKKTEEPLTTVLSGRADAFRSAEIRPRVGGVIKQIAVKEGSFVKTGDLLYKIEDDTYQASLAEAQAALERS